MLIEQINFTEGQLNSTSGTVVEITDIDLPVNSFISKHYRPIKIKVNNQSGATINFALFTDFEYSAYLDDPSISHLIPVLNSDEEIITSPIGKISTVLCSGTVASHSSGVIFVITKEAI